MTNILIADDYPIVREGLKRIIQQDPSMRVGAEASNGDEVLQAIARESFDLLLLDISMPGRDGFEVLRHVRSMQPKLPVLVLTAHAANQFGVRFIRAGASGFLNKEAAPTELLTAIRKVCSGGKYFSAPLAEEMARWLTVPNHDAPHSTLSEREFQILHQITLGRTLHQIADQLSLSVKTIRTYRERVLKKLNARTDAELVTYAFTHKLFEREAGHQ